MGGVPNKGSSDIAVAKRTFHIPFEIILILVNQSVTVSKDIVSESNHLYFHKREKRSSNAWIRSIGLVS